MSAASPLVFDRYELKYQIPSSLVAPVSRVIEAYCDLDPYSEKSPDGYYTVNSLYLDTPSNLFLRRKLDGESDRFNLRIRGYGEADLFFEVKFKSQGFVKKRRAHLRGELPALIQELRDTETEREKPKNLDLFLRTLDTYGAEPKVLTQYRRKAYFSRYDDYARITFDRDLRFMEEQNFNVLPDEARMDHYDHEEIFHEGKDVVLELKCPQQVPLWFIDVITRFNLVRCGFSKYASAAQHLLGPYQFLSSSRTSAHATI